MGTKKKRNIKPAITKWYENIPTIAWVLVLVSFIAIISIRRNDEMTRSTPASSPANSPINWKRVTNPRVAFFTKIFLERNKTYIGIPFKYESGIQITWLTLQSSSSATPTEWLVAHPNLNNLTWSSINDGTIYLYQKKKQYNSMADFLKNPPPPNLLVIDESVQQVSTYSGVKGTPLYETFNPNDYDFILTTFIRSEQNGNELYYENIVDASLGYISANDKLTWEISVPSATESAAYSIGEIHVDYR
jgi:hypothetical protein